jgi:hypothetical protein
LKPVKPQKPKKTKKKTRKNRQRNRYRNHENQKQSEKSAVLGRPTTSVAACVLDTPPLEPRHWLTSLTTAMWRWPSYEANLIVSATPDILQSDSRLE